MALTVTSAHVKVAEASSAARDRATSHAYLSAIYAFERAFVGNLPASIRADEALATKIDIGCPNVAAGSPQGNQLNELSAESLLAVVLAYVQPDRRALEHVAAIAAHLRWSNRKLTRLVHSLAAEDALGAELSVPDLCADWKAWMSSGYRTLSPGTEAFMRSADKLIGNETTEQTLILSLLAPYESQSDRVTAHHLRRLETSNEKRFEPAFSHVLGSISHALGLPGPEQQLQTVTAHPL
jgi:hypothetical protein